MIRWLHSLAGTFEHGAEPRVVPQPRPCPGEVEVDRQGVGGASRPAPVGDAAGGSRGPGLRHHRRDPEPRPPRSPPAPRPGALEGGPRCPRLPVPPGKGSRQSLECAGVPNGRGDRRLPGCCAEARPDAGRRESCHRRRTRLRRSSRRPIPRHPRRHSFHRQEVPTAARCHPLRDPTGVTVNHSRLIGPGSERKLRGILPPRRTGTAREAPRGCRSRQ